jgi:hypothetical protein
MSDSVVPSWLLYDDLTKTVQSGECYGVDTSGLIVSSSGKAKQLNYLWNDNEDAPRAQVAVNSDGSADFVLNCETYIYMKLQQGDTWLPTPQYGMEWSV